MNKFLITLLTFAPSVVYAQGRSPGTFEELINLFIDLIKMLFPIMVGIALLVFFKGLIGFISKAGDAKSHTDGKNLMIWGLIALFAMVSVFGILRFFYGDLGFGSSRSFGIPLLPTRTLP